MHFSHDFVLGGRKILILHGLNYNLETKGLMGPSWNSNAEIQRLKALS